MTEEEKIKDLALEFALSDILCNSDSDVDRKEYQALLDADSDDNASNHALVLDYYENDTVETVIDVIEEKVDSYLAFLKRVKMIKK